MDEDGFVTVGRRGKPHHGLAVPVEKVPEDDEAPLDLTATTARYHPDFAIPLTPSHVLIRTGDGSLFWFSLSLLTRHSTVFAEIDHDTLRHFGSSKPASRCLHLPTVSACGFAFVLHAILLDWRQRQCNTIYEKPPQLPLPESAFHYNVITMLNQALATAEGMGMRKFTKLVSRHLIDRAQAVMSDDPWQAIALAAAARSLET